MPKVADPAPGTGTSFTPDEEPVVPQEAQKVVHKAAAEAGITTPAVNPGPRPPMGTVVTQLSDDELYTELETLNLNEFVKKHTEDNKANIDTMARVTRLSREEIFHIQRELGFPLPEGA